MNIMRALDSLVLCDQVFFEYWFMGLRSLEIPQRGVFLPFERSL